MAAHESVSLEFMPPTVNQDGLQQAIERLERRTNSDGLVYCADGAGSKTMEASDVRIMFEGLSSRRRKDAKLTFVLGTPGGQITSAYRLATLLRDHAKDISIHVPYRARSAGTLLCLMATEIVLGPLAELSPLDPRVLEPRLLGDQKAGGSPPLIASEEVTAYLAMAEEWFHLKGKRNGRDVLEILTSHVSPAVLGALFRADRYTRKIAEELLAFQLPAASRRKRVQIVNRLISSYTEHLHSFTHRELQAIGLRVRKAQEAEHGLTWAIWQECQLLIKAFSTSGMEGNPRAVAVLATRDFCAINWRPQTAPPGNLDTPAPTGRAEWTVLTRGASAPQG